MSGRRLALVIVTGEYENSALQALRSPAADADALVGVLTDPAVAAFEVVVVRDAMAHEIMAAIEEQLSEVRPDDLVLVHFSGHGLKDEAGSLYLAAHNTRPDRLASTGVAADFVQRAMNTCRARRLVLLLDCCYGGAFGRGVRVRASGSANVLEAFPSERTGGGRGRAVISASSSMEFAFEGTRLAGDKQPPSVFTQAVVSGLRTGDADLDGDGLITLDELYEYVYDKVREQNPRQSPTRRVELEGDLVLATSARGPVPVPAPVASQRGQRADQHRQDPGWRPLQLAAAAFWIYAAATAVLLATVMLPIRYSRSMVVEALHLIAPTVGTALVCGLVCVLLVAARRRSDPGLEVCGLAFGGAASAVNLGGLVLWTWLGNNGFVTSTVVAELLACLSVVVGAVIIWLSLRRSRIELWLPSALRSGVGLALILAGVAGAVGSLLQFLTTSPWDEPESHIPYIALTAALCLLIPMASGVLRRGSGGLRVAWVITLLAVITQTVIAVDPWGFAGAGHIYRIDDVPLFEVGILLVACSAVILVVAPAIRRWRLATAS